MLMLSPKPLCSLYSPRLFAKSCRGGSGNSDHPNASGARQEPKLSLRFVGNISWSAERCPRCTITEHLVDGQHKLLVPPRGISRLPLCLPKHCSFGPSVLEEPPSLVRQSPLQDGEWHPLWLSWSDGAGLGHEPLLCHPFWCPAH